jgi:hypothetical protein
MPDGGWRGFVKTLAFDVERGRTPVPKPTRKELDAYEKETGFTLPKGYRAFVLAVGPGKFVRTFNVTSPGYPKRKRDVSIEELNELYRETQTPNDLNEYSNDPERALRLRVFADSERGSFFGWDPKDVTDPDGHEYGVYELDRRYHVNRVADTFRGFVEDYILGDGFLRRIGGEWDEEDYGHRRAFRPALTPLTKGKKAKDGGGPRPLFPVAAGGVDLGTFALPRASDDDPSGKTRRLLIPPERFGEGGGNLLWTEVADGGDPVSMMWIPQSDAERAEMERFIEAAGRVNWDEAGPHNVG